MGPCHTRAVGEGTTARTSAAELVAFEVATRDLVGLALRSVEALEISLSQFRLLLVLHEHGRSTSTQCAKALGVQGSSVTRLADRLHASGHLVRGADPGNRSIVTLELTDAGRRVVQQVRTRRRRELRRVLDRLDPSERAACAAALDEVHRMVDVESPDPHLRLPL
jgi:DNA-binding MarR family transcriptional regulator